MSKDHWPLTLDFAAVGEKDKVRAALARTGILYVQGGKREVRRTDVRFMKFAVVTHLSQCPSKKTPICNLVGKATNGRLHLHISESLSLPSTVCDALLFMYVCA